jgi:hypothetical protein
MNPALVEMARCGRPQASKENGGFGWFPGAIAKHGNHSF